MQGGVGFVEDNVGRLYVEILARLQGTTTPETFTYAGNGFDGVLDWTKRLCLPCGEPMSVHGMEYDAYYGAGLLAFCYGAVLKRDPRECTGNSFIDDEVLAEEGVTDFSKYQADPSGELALDLFIDGWPE